MAISTRLPDLAHWKAQVACQQGCPVATDAGRYVQLIADDGFGLLDYNINIVVDPGETKTVTFKADKPGVFPYYCTNFCSALHQEMQGYLIVKPRKG